MRALEADENANGPGGSSLSPSQVLVLPSVESKRVDLIGLAAERAGFEPAVGFDPHAALAKRCYRPLSHLSGLWGKDLRQFAFLSSASVTIR